MKRIILAFTFLFLLSAASYAQAAEQDDQQRYAAFQQEAPTTEFAFEIRAVCDPAFEVGETPKGKRVVIPIVGGSFDGPSIRGKVLSGGADYQLVDEKHNRTELEAIYCIQTEDGVNIHVRNRGILCDGKDGFYFRCTPIFEAPYDSPYAWLNDKIFVCAPGFGDGYISLKMYVVK